VEAENDNRFQNSTVGACSELHEPCSCLTILFVIHPFCFYNPSCYYKSQMVQELYVITLILQSFRRQFIIRHFPVTGCWSAQNSRASVPPNSKLKNWFRLELLQLILLSETLNCWSTYAYCRIKQFYHFCIPRCRRYVCKYVRKYA
jgi:hypothetical protein